MRTLSRTSPALTTGSCACVNNALPGASNCTPSFQPSPHVRSLPDHRRCHLDQLQLAGCILSFGGDTIRRPAPIEGIIPHAGNRSADRSPRQCSRCARAARSPEPSCDFAQASCTVAEPIPAKHKLALVDLKPGDLDHSCTAWWWAKQLRPSRAAVCSQRATFATAPAATPRSGIRSPSLCPMPRPGPAAHSWDTTAPTARWARATTGSCFRSSSARTATSSACRRRSKKSWATAAPGTAIARMVRATRGTPGCRKWSRRYWRRAHSHRARLPQHRRRPLPHPSGRLRRHAPGRAGALRPSRRIHPSPQRRRRNRAEPRLPECAGHDADG